MLVFDWDGTLVDSEAKIVACVEETIAELDLEPRDSSLIRDIIGLGLGEALERLFPGVDAALAEEFVRRYRYWFLQGFGRESALFPGVREALAGLRADGYKLAVATGKGRVGLERELDVTELRGLFDATRCADETLSKPHPRMLLDLMRTLAVDSGETMMIGDTSYDLEMAQRAGTSSIAVSYGVHEVERLLQFGPVMTVDSIPELRDRLRRSAPPVLSANPT